MADRWRRRLLTSTEDVLALLRTVSRVAILGARPPSMAHKAAYFVPQALQAMGVSIVPIVVHDHAETHILGEPVYRRLVDVPGQLDLVDVFRRPEDVPGHVDDILARGPRAVWLQSGIRHDAVAEQLARAGIQVVQDRCLMVDYRALGRA